MSVEPLRIFVLDSSAIIDAKRLPVAQQWPALARLRELVAAGRLVFPRQVVSELTRGQHPDAPGAWIADAANMVNRTEPSSESLRRVLAVAQVVEIEADEDVADPYVAAMALEILPEAGHVPVVVTHDVVDRLPLKESLRTACERLRIETCDLAALITWSTTPDADRLVMPEQPTLGF